MTRAHNVPGLIMFASEMRLNNDMKQMVNSRRHTNGLRIVFGKYETSMGSTLCLLVSPAGNNSKQFRSRSSPTKPSGLIWIQIVLQSDGIL